MQEILLSEKLIGKVSPIQLSCIVCDVELVQKNEELWTEVQQKIVELSRSMEVENISKLPAILASRNAYKACGKDPARYRLSAEALLRRIVNRGKIYQVNNVVDLLNLVSISTGFSIGGYDADKIIGSIEFGIGESKEPYIGIGRGEMNIENMPVFRDETGAFGTPTSDSVRTSVTLETLHFLMIIIDFAANRKLNAATEMAVELLRRYGSAKEVECNLIST